VAQAVVDLLEAVEIEEEDGKRGVPPAGLRERREEPV